MKVRKIIQPILLSAIVVMLFSSLFVCVGATNGFVEQSDVGTVFKGLDTSTKVNEDTYPFNTRGSIDKVGFDIKYGTMRPLVYYSGEIPYFATRAGYDKDTGKVDDKAADGFESLPYNKRELGAFGENKDYWGKDFAASVQTYENSLKETGTGSASISDFEAAAAAENKSLRLYALTMSEKISGIEGILTSFKGGIYSLFSWLAWFASLIASLVIRLKNVNMATILEILDLTTLQETINHLFVKTESGGLAPFALICICTFIINVVAFVYSYTRGQKRQSNLFGDIILVALAGLIVLGIGLIPGGANQLGTSISDFIASTTTEVAGANASSTIWQTKTSGTDSNPSNDTMYTEISMLNKMLIDTQICAQFGVNDIDKLSTTNLPNHGGISASTLSKFDNNLGYFYWYGNSGASNTENAGAYTLNVTKAQSRVEQVITYLQATYNNTADAKTKNLILNIVGSFCSPQSFSTILKFLLITAIYVLTVWCLTKYAFQITIAKLSLIFGCLGLSISGLLIASTNKKMSSIGKSIISIFVLSFIKITVLSIFFDMILFILAQIVDSREVTMLVAVALLVLFAKMNPIISQKINAFFDSVERSIAPELRSVKAGMRQAAQRNLHNFRESYNKWNEKHGKVVGYDENGNAIRKSSRGGIFDTALEFAENSVSRTGLEQRTAAGILRSQKDIRDNENARIQREQIKSGNRIAGNEYESAFDEVDTIANQIQSETDTISEGLTDERRTGEYNHNGVKYSLNANEQDMRNKVRAIDSAISSIESNSEYQSLVYKRTDGETLSDQDEAIIRGYEDKLSMLKSDRHEAEAALKSMVHDRIGKDVTAAYRTELDEAMSNADAATKKYLSVAGASAKGLKSSDVSTDAIDNDVFKQQAKLDMIRESIKDTGAYTDGADVHIKQQEIESRRTAYLNGTKYVPVKATREERDNHGAQYTVGSGTTYDEAGITGRAAGAIVGAVAGAAAGEAVTKKVAGLNIRKKVNRENDSHIENAINISKNAKPAAENGTISDGVGIRETYKQTKEARLRENEARQTLNNSRKQGDVINRTANAESAYIRPTIEASIEQQSKPDANRNVETQSVNNSDKTAGSPKTEYTTQQIAPKKQTSKAVDKTADSPIRHAKEQPQSVDDSSRQTKHSKEPVQKSSNSSSDKQRQSNTQAKTEKSSFRLFSKKPKSDVSDAQDKGDTVLNGEHISLNNESNDIRLNGESLGSENNKGLDNTRSAFSEVASNISDFLHGNKDE